MLDFLIGTVAGFYTFWLHESISTVKAGLIFSSFIFEKKIFFELTLIYVQSGVLTYQLKN
jgi:hypothetical protein